MTRPERPDYLATKRPVKSADRVIEVVHVLAVEPLTFEGLRQRLGYPRSSLHGLLTTLERRGWVHYERGRGFTLCAVLADVGVRELLRVGAQERVS